MTAPENLLKLKLNLDDALEAGAGVQSNRAVDFASFSYFGDWEKVVAHLHAEAIAPLLARIAELEAAIHAIPTFQLVDLPNGAVVVRLKGGQ